MTVRLNLRRWKGEQVAFQHRCHVAADKFAQGSVHGLAQCEYRGETRVPRWTSQAGASHVLLRELEIRRDDEETSHFACGLPGADVAPTERIAMQNVTDPCSLPNSLI
jgi:hypothetical protein